MMNKLIRRLPLQVKLLLIGLIPTIFVIALSLQAYRQSQQKMAILANYQIYLRESQNINGLIESLQDERQYSLDYALTGKRRSQLMLQQPRTDAFIERLNRGENPSLRGFAHYTKLGEIGPLRARIDARTASPNEIMHFYSNSIFRMNTLNTVLPANAVYLDDVYGDLQAQKILSEMVTYLSIINSNIYNVLHTRAYMTETLMGTIGTYDVFKSYQTELAHKATPQIRHEFAAIADTTALKPTLEYIGKLFTTFDFGQDYTASEWLEISEQGADEMRALQAKVRASVNKSISDLYAREARARQKSLIILAMALVLMVSAALYVGYIIASTVNKLRVAAKRISNGETHIDVRIESQDSIGQLARSIAAIDLNNRRIAESAAAIGAGEFNVPFEPRGENDKLGIAIRQMQHELDAYHREMERLVSSRTEELTRSNEDLHQFAHVASHDLKEPLRKIATFSNILMHEHSGLLPERGKLYLGKIESAANRMSVMIEGVLAYSTLATDEKPFERVPLEKVLLDVQNDLELAIIQKEATLQYDNLPDLHGMPLLLHQLFYNLINNALKFSRPGEPPHIHITAEPTTDVPVRNRFVNREYAKITVRDNGIGFRPEYAERMFDVFSRLHSRDRYEGTGLGLALCRKIARRHRGEIRAEGLEGQGATFYLLLPLA